MQFSTARPNYAVVRFDSEGSLRKKGGPAMQRFTAIMFGVMMRSAALASVASAQSHPNVAALAPFIAGTN